MIVKTRWKCKSTTQHSDGLNSQWINVFIKGKWYDCEYETWSSSDGFRLNGGWKRYWAINENGEKSELSKSEATLIFYQNIDDLRDAKIDLIIND